MLKSGAQKQGPWTFIYYSLIDFNEGTFLSTSKIKCETTGRPQRCPHPQMLLVKSDYNPGTRNETKRTDFPHFGLRLRT